MRWALLLGLLLALDGCSTDTFVDPTDGATSDGPADGPIADAAAVPIRIENATLTIVTTGADPVSTITPTPTPGNAVIVAITCFSEVDQCTIPATGVTDNQGNTYRRVIEGSAITSQPGHGSRGYIFIAESVGPSTGPFTIRIDANGAPDANVQDFVWGVLEVSGLATSNTVDKTGYTPMLCCDASTTVSTSGPTTQANELAVAVHSLRTNTGSSNIGHEPTWDEHHVHVNASSSGTPHSTVSKILQVSGIVSHTWTHVVPSRGTSAVIATFKGRTP